jgi:hypothetical protein
MRSWLSWFKRLDSRVRGIRKKQQTASLDMQNMQTAVQDATDADRAMAQKRLKTWIPEVNPDDHSHIGAYLLANMQNKQRVGLQAVLSPMLAAIP